MINLEKIGQKITELRKKKNLKQNELADILFVTHQAVSKWENGKSLPSIDVMYEMTKLFDISIDYLLEETEIRENDYETKFRLFPRDSVIRQFLMQKDLDEKIEEIFYLLSKGERKRIIDMIISGKVMISPKSIWHMMSKDERTYLLGVILSNKMDFNLSTIRFRLTDTEANLVRTRIQEGVYRYRLP